MPHKSATTVAKWGTSEDSVPDPKPLLRPAGVGKVACLSLLDGADSTSSSVHLEQAQLFPLLDKHLGFMMSTPGTPLEQTRVLPRKPLVIGKRSRGMALRRLIPQQLLTCLTALSNF